MTSQVALFGVDHLQPGDALDYFVTPEKAFMALLPKIPTPESWAVLEPSAGNGVLLGHALKHLPVSAAWAFELHAGRFAELAERFPDVCTAQGDFLDQTEQKMHMWASHPHRHLVPMNPPYSKPRDTIALEFMDAVLSNCPPDAFVAAMLPLAFAETRKRAAFHRKWKGSLYPLAFRPDCGGEYGGGSRAFAWFTWDLLNPKNEWEPVG